MQFIDWDWACSGPALSPAGRRWSASTGRPLWSAGGGVRAHGYEVRNASTNRLACGLAEISDLNADYRALT